MYRQDNRSKKEFKLDIKTQHKIESDIAIRLCVFNQQKTGKWPTITPLGTDYTGEIVNDKQVSTDADYKINKTNVEITKSNTICNRFFHEKVGKVARCINGDFHMVFVNGFTVSQEPNFVIISPKLMKELTDKSIAKYGVVRMPARNKGILQKPAYRYDISLFENMWMVLPKLPKIIPSEYKNILEAVCQ